MKLKGIDRGPHKRWRFRVYGSKEREMKASSFVRWAWTLRIVNPGIRSKNIVPRNSTADHGRASLSNEK